MDRSPRHYITVDERKRIINGFSDVFRQPKETDICINEEGTRHFRLFPDGEDNPMLFELEHLLPRFKFDGYVQERTAEEIAADITELPDPEETPSQLDMIEAQVTYTAMMTDTLLEG